MSNASVAARLVGTLAGAGVRHVVISPGSRSTPIALACAAHPDLQLHVVIDERSAAFFALGLALAEQTPPVLVCTSGSAAAHYHPAVIEAYESGVPLIVISSDRPARLHGCGAPQTTNQHELFGSHALSFAHVETPDLRDLRGIEQVARDAWLVSTHGYQGPVHVNVAFDEPLAMEPEVFYAPAPPKAPQAARHVPPLKMPAGDGVVIAGPRARVDVATLLELGVPVLADPLSGLRADPRVISTYDAWLRSPHVAKSLRPRWVLRFGRPPTSKALGQWLGTLDAQQVVVDPFDKRFDPYDTSPVFVRAVDRVSHRSSRRFYEYVEDLERAACAATAQFVEDHDFFEGSLMRSLPHAGGLFVASSMAVRDADTFLTSGRSVRVFANRGVNGIDGQISTAAGLAAGGAVQVAVVGDLAALHDLSGFALARRHGLCVVIVQNHGGGIFEYLPIAKASEHFEELFITPHDHSFESVARMFDLPYRRFGDGEDFSPGVVEAHIPRERSVSLHHELWAAIEEAVPDRLRRTA